VDNTVQSRKRSRPKNENFLDDTCVQAPLAIKSKKTFIFLLLSTFLFLYLASISLGKFGSEKPTLNERYCAGGDPSDYIVALAFNPTKPLLVCLLDSGMVSTFSGEISYLSSFDSWNGKVFNKKIQYPKVVAWNVGYTNLHNDNL
jgi:hypothetical protein